MEDSPTKKQSLIIAHQNLAFEGLHKLRLVATNLSCLLKS